MSNQNNDYKSSRITNEEKKLTRIPYLKEGLNKYITKFTSLIVEKSLVLNIDKYTFREIDGLCYFLEKTLEIKSITINAPPIQTQEQVHSSSVKSILKRRKL